MKDDLHNYINIPLHTKHTNPQVCGIMKHPFRIAHALIFKRIKMGGNKKWKKKIQEKHEGKCANVKVS